MSNSTSYLCQHEVNFWFERRGGLPISENGFPNKTKDCHTDSTGILEYLQRNVLNVQSMFLGVIVDAQLVAIDLSKGTQKMGLRFEIWNQ